MPSHFFRPKPKLRLRTFPARPTTLMQGEIDFDTQPWPRISNDAKDLIRKLLTVDPTKRITVHQVSSKQSISCGSSYGGSCITLYCTLHSTYLDLVHSTAPSSAPNNVSAWAPLLRHSDSPLHRLHNTRCKCVQRCVDSCPLHRGTRSAACNALCRLALYSAASSETPTAAMLCGN